MNSVAEILTELKLLGTDQTRKIFIRHGAPAEGGWGRAKRCPQQFAYGFGFGFGYGYGYGYGQEAVRR